MITMLLVTTGVAGEQVAEPPQSASPPEGYVVLPGVLFAMLGKPVEPPAGEEYWQALGLKAYPDAKVFVIDREATEAWSRERVWGSGPTPAEVKEFKPDAPALHEIMALMLQAAMPKYVLETTDSLEAIQGWMKANAPGWKIGEIETLDFEMEMSGPEGPEDEDAEPVPPDLPKEEPEDEWADWSATGKQGFVTEHAEREGLVIVTMDHAGARYLMVTDGGALVAGFAAMLMAIMPEMLAQLAGGMVDAMGGEGEPVEGMAREGLDPEVKRELEELLAELKGRPGPAIPE